MNDYRLTYYPTPVTYHDAANSLAVEKYWQEIDRRIDSLRCRLPNESLTVISGKILNMELEIAASKIAFAKMSRKKEHFLEAIRKIWIEKEPEDAAHIVKSIVLLDTEIEDTAKRLKAEQEHEALCLKKIKTPFPKKALLDALICPLSGEPLYDAIVLKTGARVNAYAVGLKYHKGKIEDPGSIRDFKAIELANYFFPPNSESVTGKISPLYDQVRGGLYSDPKLLPCGHTSSAYTCFLAGCKQIAYRTDQVFSHTLLKSFIDAYRISCRLEIIKEEKQHLNNLVAFKLKNQSEVQEQLVKLENQEQLIVKKNQANLKELQAVQAKMADLSNQKQFLVTQRKISVQQLKQLKEQRTQWQNQEKLNAQMNKIEKECLILEINILKCTSTLDSLTSDQEKW